MWRSEDGFQELVLSFHEEGHQVRQQEPFHLLRQFAGPPGHLCLSNGNKNQECGAQDGTMLALVPIGMPGIQCGRCGHAS